MVYSRARYNRMAFGLLARWAWRGFEISFTLSELIVKLMRARYERLHLSECWSRSINSNVSRLMKIKFDVKMEMGVE